MLCETSYSTPQDFYPLPEGREIYMPINQCMLNLLVGTNSRTWSSLGSSVARQLCVGLSGTHCCPHFYPPWFLTILRQEDPHACFRPTLETILNQERLPSPQIKVLSLIPPPQIQNELWVWEAMLSKQLAEKCKHQKVCFRKQWKRRVSPGRWKKRK